MKLTVRQGHAAGRSDTTLCNATAALMVHHRRTTASGAAFDGRRQARAQFCAHHRLSRHRECGPGRAGPHRSAAARLIPESCEKRSCGGPMSDLGRAVHMEEFGRETSQDGGPLRKSIGRHPSSATTAQTGASDERAVTDAQSGTCPEGCDPTQEPALGAPRQAVGATAQSCASSNCGASVSCTRPDPSVRVRHRWQLN